MIETSTITEVWIDNKESVKVILIGIRVLIFPTVKIMQFPTSFSLLRDLNLTFRKWNIETYFKNNMKVLFNSCLLIQEQCFVNYDDDNDYYYH